MQILIQWALSIFYFLQQWQWKVWITDIRIFFHMRQVFSFRLQQIPNLTQVRCTDEIKLGNWDLSSSHHRIDPYENLTTNCTYRTPFNNSYIKLIKSILSYNNSHNDTAIHVGAKYFHIAKENGRRLRQNVNQLLKTHWSSLFILPISRIINNPINCSWAMRFIISKTPPYSLFPGIKGIKIHRSMK